MKDILTKILAFAASASYNGYNTASECAIIAILNILIKYVDFGSVEYEDIGLLTSFLDDAEKKMGFKKGE